MMPILTCLSAVILAVQMASPPLALPLPEAATRRLNQQYRGWKPADPVASCPAPHPSIITGDFNGDKRQDWAIRLIDGGGQTRLIVLIGRLGDVESVDVGSSGAEGEIVALKAGTKYTERGKLLEDYFGADALGEGPCGRADHAYVWTGTGFRKVLLGSPSA